MSNTKLINEGLDLIYEASRDGVFAYVNYFLPVYDHRIDTNVHVVGSDLWDRTVVEYSAADATSASLNTIFGEKIYNIGNSVGYTLSHHKCLIVNDTSVFDVVNKIVDYDIYNEETQSNTAQVNLYNGVPLSNIVSGASIGWDNVIPGFSASNDSIAIVSGTGAPHTNLFDALYGSNSATDKNINITYAPIVSTSNTRRGLYKFILDGRFGDFKFNKILCFVSKLDENNVVDTTVEPKLLAIGYLDTTIKGKSGFNISNYEFNLELELTNDDVPISAVAFYPGTDWARTPAVDNQTISGIPCLHWDGFVGIRTYINGNQGPQVPLHIMEEGVTQAQFRIGNASNNFVDFIFGDESIGPYYYYYSLVLAIGSELNPGSLIPKYISDLGDLIRPWANLYTNDIFIFRPYYNFQLYSKYDTFYGKTRLGLGFDDDGSASDLSTDGRFFNGDIVRNDMCGLLMYTESLWDPTSEFYQPTKDGIFIIAGYDAWHKEIDVSTAVTHNQKYDVFKDNANEAFGGLYINGWRGDPGDRWRETNIKLISPGNAQIINYEGMLKIKRYFISDPEFPLMASWIFEIRPSESNDGDFAIYRDFDERSSPNPAQIGFAANLIPRQDSYYYLGNDTHYWENLYVNNTHTDYLVAKNGAYINIYNDLYPSNYSFSLGGINNYWLDLFVNSVNVNFIKSNSIITITNELMPLETGFRLGTIGVPWGEIYGTEIHTSDLIINNYLSTKNVYTDHIYFTNNGPNSTAISEVGVWLDVVCNLSPVTDGLEVSFGGGVLTVTALGQIYSRYMLIGNTIFINIRFKIETATGSATVMYIKFKGNFLNYIPYDQSIYRHVPIFITSTDVGVATIPLEGHGDNSNQGFIITGPSACFTDDKFINLMAVYNYQ